MNITELIVDYLKQGHVVELPNIGTLSNQRQSAHMDDATRTFHAGQDAVTFSSNTNGNNDIVKYLAEVECVDMKIAQMMWKNYVDALNDKLSRTGSHQFPGIGELRMASGSYQFDGIATPVSGDTPVITDVKHYEADNSDPFAAFDAPKEEPMPEPEPEPEPIPEQEPEPEPEPEIPEPIATPKATEEAEVPAMPETPEVPEPMEAPVFTETPAPAETPDTPIQKTESDIFAGISDIAEPTKGKKKKKHGWLWLLLLLLLLAAGGYYYYTHYYHKAETEQPAATNDSIDDQTVTATEEDITTSEETDEITEAKAYGDGYMDIVNIFTFNTDLLEYDANEFVANRNIILNNLNEYWSQFLSNRHYSNAMPYMQTAFSEYIDNRLAELFNNEGYSVRRFFNSDDNLHQFFYNELKSKKASHARVTIQSELMDYDMLDEMLRQVVEANDLTASDVGIAATTVKPKTKEEPKAEGNYTAHMESSSKQGFDVIAGFYTNRQSAIKMTSRLKSLGCDAYIIDHNHLYYVSMGSAPTRTAAEALYKQITSWYSGSVAIKQW